MRYQTIIVMITLNVCAFLVKLGPIHPLRTGFLKPRMASRLPVYLLSTKYPLLSSIESVDIMGGSLAGLSTAYSLLNRNTKQKIPKITILDIKILGYGGTSVAAGR